MALVGSCGGEEAAYSTEGLYFILSPDSSHVFTACLGHQVGVLEGEVDSNQILERPLLMKHSEV